MDKKQEDNNPLKKFPEELAKLNEDLKVAFDTFNNSLRKAHQQNLKNAKSLRESADRLGIPVQEKITCPDCYQETNFLINGRCYICHNYLMMIRIYPER